MLQIAIRTLIIYAVLVIIMRLMGKRQIGEMQLSELVVTLMLSEIAAIPIVEEEYSVLDAILPVVLLVALEMLISFAVTKSARLKIMLDGRPSVVIRDGKIRMSELKHLRITIDELLSELRQKDIFDIRDVEYALIENNGKLSVCLYDSARAASTEDLDIEPCRPSLAHTLIVDGAVCKSSLAILDADLDWLLCALKERDLSPEDILLMTVDKTGELYILKKDGEEEGKR